MTSLYKIRGYDNPQNYYGKDIQPQRLETVLKYTNSNNMVLDLGTGRGAYVKALTNKGFPSVGIDLTYFFDWHQDDRPFLQASANFLPFPTHSFHTTICFEVLEHCPEPKAVLEEIARCTSTRLIMSVPNCDLDNTLRRHSLALAHWTDVTHCNFFTKDSIRRLLEDCYYKIVEIADCYPVQPNNYFWDSVRLPWVIRKSMQRLFAVLNLVEIYWSSILVVAEVPKI
jgi:ubiquinone/menaquinone biosynthesis C-methylase UbiE